MPKSKPIDIEALEKKRQKIKSLIENPHSREYRDKLAELLNAKINARDNFVNWITGLATGSMYLYTAH